MADYIQVATTTATRAEAERIASNLVERRLAACAQVSGPVQSVYHWQGAVEQGEEWQCTLKTHSALFTEVAAAIRELHSYQCPQIVATSLVELSEDYRAWLDRELTE